MLNHDEQYMKMMINILDHGIEHSNRTGVKTFSVFGRTMTFDISENKIPLLTTKFVWMNGILHELLWMLSGDTTIKYLKENKINIWDNWLIPDSVIRDEEGNITDGQLPKIYQHQWRKWNDTRIIENNPRIIAEHENKGFEVKGYFTQDEKAQVVVTRQIDQIKKIEEQLKNDPNSRRIILSAWNVADIEEMALPPCHMLAQFKCEELTEEERIEVGVVENKLNDIDPHHINIKELMDERKVPLYRLNCMLVMRSNDFCAGNPFNIVQYSVLTQMLARVSNMVAGKLFYVGGDVHIYEDQLEGCVEQLGRPGTQTEPKLEIKSDKKSILDYKFEDFQLTNYQHNGKIHFPVAT